MTNAEHEHAGEGLLENWRARETIDLRAPGGFPRMIDALRTVQDRVTGAAPPNDVVEDITRHLTAVADLLAAHSVDELHQLTGNLPIPGRAQTMSPVVYLDEQDEKNARGRVTYGRFYLGRNNAVHGGTIPLLFDEILGRFANTGGRVPSRTAYLHVDFRHVTPIEKELRYEAWFEKEEGRKRYLRGALYDGQTLCAEAEGLFVALRPGQP